LAAQQTFCLSRQSCGEPWQTMQKGYEERSCLQHGGSLSPVESKTLWRKVLLPLSAPEADWKMSVQAQCLLIGKHARASWRFL